MNFLEQFEKEIENKKLTVRTSEGEHELYSKTFIYGLPGSGKTTLCVDLMRQCLDHKQRVLFIDTENKLKSNPYFHQLFMDRKDDIMKFVQVKTDITEKNRSDILKAIENTNAEIIVIDSFTNLFHEELENHKRAKIRTFINQIHQIANGKHVVTVHHGYNKWDSIGAKKINLRGGDSIAFFADELIKIVFSKQNKRSVRFERKAVEGILPNPMEVNHG